MRCCIFWLVVNGTRKHSCRLMLVETISVCLCCESLPVLHYAQCLRSVPFSVYIYIYIYTGWPKKRPELSHRVMQQSRWNESVEKHVCNEQTSSNMSIIPTKFEVDMTIYCRVIAFLSADTSRDCDLDFWPFLTLNSCCAWRVTWFGACTVTAYAFSMVTNGKRYNS